MLTLSLKIFFIIINNGRPPASIISKNKKGQIKIFLLIKCFTLPLLYCSRQEWWHSA